MNPLFSFQTVELSLKLVVQKARQVRDNLCALFCQFGMHDSSVRDGSVTFDEALFFQLVENGYNSCRAQIRVVGKGLGRYLSQIPYALQNNNLRDGESSLPGHLTRAQVNGPDDLPDSLDHLR